MLPGAPGRHVARNSSRGGRTTKNISIPPQKKISSDLLNFVLPNWCLHVCFSFAIKVYLIYKKPIGPCVCMYVCGYISIPSHPKGFDRSSPNLLWRSNYQMLWNLWERRSCPRSVGGPAARQGAANASPRCGNEQGSHIYFEIQNSDFSWLILTIFLWKSWQF